MIMIERSVCRMRVILASSSPRRNELMKQLGIPYEVIVEKTDE